MSLDLEFRGYDRVRNALRHLASQQTDITDPVMEDWTKNMRAILKSTPYPPKRPAQRYVRTGQLANRWAAKRIKPGEWTITNEASGKSGLYAFRVVGTSPAWMHKGRWWIAIEVISNYTPELTKQLTDALVDYWNKHG